MVILQISTYINQSFYKMGNNKTAIYTQTNYSLGIMRQHPYY